MIIKQKRSEPFSESFMKVVVDVERKILAAGCELHIDCADELVEDGSEARNLWGANVYPEKGVIQFVSLINIRPRDGNRSMEIQLPDIRVKVEEIIRALVL